MAVSLPGRFDAHPCLSKLNSPSMANCHDSFAKIGKLYGGDGKAPSINQRGILESHERGTAGTQ